MRFHFTHHAKEKIALIRKAGFSVTRKKVKQAILNPLWIEDRPDGTKIATTLLDEKHVLRVVFRREDDIIIVITCYPGRRKAYGVSLRS